MEESFGSIKGRRCRVNLTHNRHIMLKMLKDKQISKEEYNTYLKEQEEREKQVTENFQKIINKLRLKE